MCVEGESVRDPALSHAPVCSSADSSVSRSMAGAMAQYPSMNAREERGLGESGADDTSPEEADAESIKLAARKQKTLRTIEKLMEQPIIDPRQATLYKDAQTQVEAVKKHIEGDLMDVVQMEMLSSRVNEAQAKHAMGIETDAANWAMKAGDAMVTAANGENGGVECVDAHPGLCAGVQIQGDPAPV